MTIVDSLFSWFRWGGSAVGTLGFAAIAALYIFQDKLLYIPNPPGFPVTPDDNPPGTKSPSEWTVAGKQQKRSDDKCIDFEDVIIDTADGQKIHAWLLLQEISQGKPTLIYFHGNAGNMGFRLQNAAEMFAKVGINVLMMDYRGYGKSTGYPTEKGLQLDATAVLNFAHTHPRLVNSPLVVFGRSLGGAVSVWLAEKYPGKVSAVVLENTFLSVSAMVDVLMPLVAPLKSLVLRIKWESDKSIRNVKQPILFISGDSDELVPPMHMKTLHELATQSSWRDFFSVSGGRHNDTWYHAGSKYYKRMKEFFDRLASGDDKKIQSRGRGGDEDGEGDCANGVAEADGQQQQQQQQQRVVLPTMGRDFKVQ